MAEALLVKSGGGTDSSDLTATLAQVLSGYTAMTSDSNDDPGTGTMPNRGAVTQSLNAGGSYTIPQGYHNGNGKVTANSLSSQTSGNASSAQILTGYNAWVNGSNVNGAMPNRGNLNFNPSGSTSQAVPSGYYSGGTLSSANAYNAGYNAGQSSRTVSFVWQYHAKPNGNGCGSYLDLNVSAYSNLSINVTEFDRERDSIVINVTGDGSSIQTISGTGDQTINISQYSIVRLACDVPYNLIARLTATISLS